jgi:dTDP-4-dehydrorhamnose 3,5-epimerase
MRADQLTTAKGYPLAGPLLLTPRLFGDDRGFFFESWNQQSWGEMLAAHGQQAEPFVQDNHSRSTQGVLRGLHWQLPPHPQAKLVRCVVGEIFDVAVDLRRNSSSFGLWVGAILSSDNHRQLWVPVGFAHGFLALSEHAEVLYKTTDFWSRDCERSLRWDDPQLAIDWPLEAITSLVSGSSAPQLSEKDALAPLMAELAAGDGLF